MMYDASGLFHKHTHQDRFVNALNITEAQDAMLRDARRKVRAAVRAAFTEARRYLSQKVNEADLALIAQIRPKFMSQGSYVYGTLNTPCHPSQEIDLDDGVYLPMAFINKEPRLSMRWFFEVVDGALRELADREGWVFKTKPTCARLALTGQQAHIDVPLYAVPDERHAAMTAQFAALDREASLTEALFKADLSIARQVRLDENEVYLAVRDEGWRQSDPLKIATWFSQEIALRSDASGQRLRRICRFLKAWRDFTWESGGPSSITLMACAVDAYPTDDKNRDDYALYQVVSQLADKLAGEIENPAENGRREVLYPREGMDTEQIAEKARDLAREVHNAVCTCDTTSGVVRCYVGKFGRRIPDNEAWVVATLPATVAAEVRSTPAREVRPERIRNTRAG